MQERTMRTRRKSLVITLLGVMLAAFVLAGITTPPPRRMRTMRRLCPIKW